MTKKHADTKAPTAEETKPVMESGGPEPASDAALTADEIEQLKTEAAKAGENWDKFLRATAEFDNYKKRAARERQEAEAGAQARMLTKFIPVLDNFEMALAATAASPDPAAQSLQAGVQMIAQQFRGVMAECGLEEINAMGKAFDPNVHEAVSQQESTEVPEGQVIQQLRKGYRLRERLLRPATVVVARKPASEGDTSA